MDERTERRVLEKAAYVREAVAVLAAKRDNLTFEDYRTDREQRDIVEREFETAIEACIDIGKMLLRSQGAEVPDTNAGVFRELGARGYSTRKSPVEWREQPGSGTSSRTNTATKSMTVTSSTTCITNCRFSGRTCRESGRFWTD